MERPSTLERHWDDKYRATPSDQLGWFEPSPSTLELVTGLTTPDDSIIDVGGGDSRMVDALVVRGYRDVTVLDVSSQALERAMCRLGDAGACVHWVYADVLRFRPERAWRLWHDRAMFHFLVDADARRAYCSVAARAISEGGNAVIAAFAPDGPSSCAGLPVARYEPDELAAHFVAAFEPTWVGRLEAGPLGDQRPYVCAILRRRPCSTAVGGEDTDR